MSRLIWKKNIVKVLFVISVFGGIFHVMYYRPGTESSSYSGFSKGFGSIDGQLYKDIVPEQELKESELSEIEKSRQSLLNFQQRDAILLKYREPLYEERRKHVRQACVQPAKLSETERSVSERLQDFIVAEDHKIIYCGIPKTGSTFWKKTLNIIESGGNFSSLFEYRNAASGKKHSLASSNKLFGKNESAFHAFYNEALSFLFVREPYGRIFSAYNNKILNPNRLYWNTVGRSVIRAVRKNPSQDSLTYGHDVTFPELIKFLVERFENNQVVDRHFAPMFEKCNPCKLPYDYIGKMESFADDVHFLLAKLRLKFKDIHIDFGDFSTESALDTAQGHVKFLFGILEATKELNYPKYNFFLRTWRDLQIRGYLSKYIEMPMTKDQTFNMTKEEFFDLIKHALEQPVNKNSSVKLQRIEAMTQAYKAIPTDDMERLKEYVKTDCLLFGYDVRPDELFSQNDDSSKTSFDYFDAI